MTAFVEKHECPPTSAVETAADHQVDVSVICCDCDVAATAHAVPAFGGGERGPALGLVPKGASHLWR